MSENTKIEWATHSWNPWTGCTKLSPGCKNCYADALAHRFKLNVWGPTADRKVASEAYWKQPLKWNLQNWQCDACQKWFVEPADLRPGAQIAPCPECRGTSTLRQGRPRVFCASMADVFEGSETCQDEAAYAAISAARVRLWALIEATPNLDWLLLTKRPENIEAMIPERWTYPGPPPECEARFPRNVWLGTSAENQEALDKRWPVLEAFCRRHYVSVAFLSLEPLLGPIDLSDYIEETIEHEEDNTIWIRGIDWVIVGGESGPNARPLHPDWARSLRDQCENFDVPFFFKQWGQWHPIDEPWKQGSPAALAENERWMNTDGGHGFHGCNVWRMRSVGKKLAGRELDGRCWDEFPAASAISATTGD